MDRDRGTRRDPIEQIFDDPERGLRPVELVPRRQHERRARPLGEVQDALDGLEPRQAEPVGQSRAEPPIRLAEVPVTGLNEP